MCSEALEIHLLLLLKLWSDTLFSTILKAIPFEKLVGCVWCRLSDHPAVIFTSFQGTLQWYFNLELAYKASSDHLVEFLKRHVRHPPHQLFKWNSSKWKFNLYSRNPQILCFEFTKHDFCNECDCFSFLCWHIKNVGLRLQNVRYTTERCIPYIWTKWKWSIICPKMLTVFV